jgi:hypothetical protein
MQCDNLLCDLRDLNKPVVKIGDLGLSKLKKGSFVSGNMRGTLPWCVHGAYYTLPEPASRHASCRGGVTAPGGRRVPCRMAPELFPSVPTAVSGVHARQETEDRVTEKVGARASAQPTWLRASPPAAALLAIGLWPSKPRRPQPCLLPPQCQVDVFSFGICMWEIWTLGEQPYPNLSLQEIFAGVMTGTLRPSLPPGCDPAWASLMQDCWQGNPRLRPGFTEIIHCLEAMLQRWGAAPPGGGGSGGAAAAAAAAAAAK